MTQESGDAAPVRSGDRPLPGPFPVPLADIAIAVLRAGLAVVFIAHGSQKLFGAFGGGGISGTAAYFHFLGADPGTFWAVLAAIAEFFGGVAMAVGMLSRLAAAALAVDMAGAIVLANWSHGFFTEKPTGGWEINMILFCMAVSVLLTGSGRFSVDNTIRPWLSERQPLIGRYL